MADQTPQTLTLSDDLATGSVQVPSDSGSYPIKISVIGIADQLLASNSQEVRVINTQQQALELVRIEPANGATGIEPNVPIELYFNKEIDLSQIQLQIRETLHGQTYINQDPPGLDFIEAEGYQLQEVHRDREPLQGKLSLLPGNKSVAYYPNRQFGYGGQIYVDLLYDNSELARTEFSIRPLPTFIQGNVVDLFGQPVAGIEVSLKELNQTVLTNKDGSYAFGYQQSADHVIPAGRYQLQVNHAGKNSRFGTHNSTITVQQGRGNTIAMIRLQELNRDIAYQRVSGGQLLNLAAGELTLDLSNAELLFSDNNRSGYLHSQFLSYEQFTAKLQPGALPLWLYAQQPRGIQVEGKVDIDMAVPALGQSYSYLPEQTDYVVIVGYNPSLEMIEPVAIGKLEHNRVKSTEAVSLDVLDYLGYAIVEPKHQASLQAVAEGRMSLLQLKAMLQSN